MKTSIFLMDSLYRIIFCPVTYFYVLIPMYICFFVKKLFYFLSLLIVTPHHFFYLVDILTNEHRNYIVSGFRVSLLLAWCYVLPRLHKISGSATGRWAPIEGGQPL